MARVCQVEYAELEFNQIGVGSQDRVDFPGVREALGNVVLAGDRQVEEQFFTFYSCIFVFTFPSSGQ